MTLIHENEHKFFINPATKLVLPRQKHRDHRPVAAERKAGIQKRSYDTGKKI
jgi:hypothetical protein